LHPTKTRIVYCKDDRRPGDFEPVSFDFLGYTFRPREASGRRGKRFVGFLPAISPAAAKAIRATMREWRWPATKATLELADLARLSNPIVRGWLNYYGQFYRSRCVQVLAHLNVLLVQWVRRKYTRFRYRVRRAVRWLGSRAHQEPSLFVLWQLGIRPTTERVRAG
jgi:RNA-directed DNA polymerase